MPSPSVLRFGLFFDGTGNNLANTSDAETTHIARLFKLYPNDHQHVGLYIEGIGTCDGEPDSRLAMATGAGDLGWETQVAQARLRLLARLKDWLERTAPEEGIRLELDLFGFSRGAACARHFANDVHAKGKSLLCALLRNDPAARAALPTPQDAMGIRFIGLFDTVTAITQLGTVPTVHLRADLAQRIVHLVAADEHRDNFPLCSAGQYDLPLPGAHADLGGGYPPLMEERLLLTRPDRSFTARRQPLTGAPSYLRSAALLEQRKAQAPDYGFDHQVLAWPRNPNVGDPRIDEVQVYAALEGRREVSNALAWVYLEIMHQLACAEGVALLPLPPAGYPAELAPMAAKLRAHAHAWAAGDNGDAQLSNAEQALLYRRYIHHSSHWGRDGATPTSDLDSLYIHRPAPQGKRRILRT